MSSPAPADELAAITRGLITRHDTWDSLHQLLTITWDGSKVDVHTATMIDPRIHPTLYPDLIAKTATRAAVDCGDIAFALALQIEAYSVTPPIAPSRKQAARFARDQRERRFHERPDAVEMAMAFCVDVTGRFWTAGKRRPEPDHIEETFAPYARNAPHSGVFVMALADAVGLLRKPL